MWAILIPTDLGHGWGWSCFPGTWVQDECLGWMNSPPTKWSPQGRGLRRGDPGGCIQHPPLFFTSVSMRIPGSSSSIEEKLEKYTSAVQVEKPGWEVFGGREGVVWS